MEEIVIGEDRVRSAKPGENVLIKLPVNAEDVQKGYVICHPSNLCPAVLEVKVQLALVDMLEHRPLFTPGTSERFAMHRFSVSCLTIYSFFVHRLRGCDARAHRRNRSCLPTVGRSH